MKTVSLYSAIASAVMARENCSKTMAENASRAEWFDKHTDRVETLVKEHMPHGSGFDSGCALDFEASNPDKLVFCADFHHMDEHGYYDGWSTHTVVIRPSLAWGFTVTVTGRNRNQIKEFIADTFHHCGTIQVSRY